MNVRAAVVQSLTKSGQALALEQISDAILIAREKGEIVERYRVQSVRLILLANEPGGMPGVIVMKRLTAPESEGSWKRPPSITMPGGRVESGDDNKPLEGVFESALRETLEESGVRLKPEDLFVFGIRKTTGADRVTVERDEHGNIKADVYLFAHLGPDRPVKYFDGCPDETGSPESMSCASALKLQSYRLPSTQAIGLAAAISFREVLGFGEDAMNILSQGDAEAAAFLSNPRNQGLLETFDLGFMIS